MVPRPDVVTLPAETPLRQLAKVVVTGNYTRYPLFEGENVDRIIGAVHVKDILQAAEAAGSFEADVVARDLMRELITVPENRLIEAVLAEFQRRRIHMAVVIDEWGSFEGIITLEDILEEIVGEIRDEFDEEEPVIRKMEDGSYSIEGRIPIKAVNEVLGSTFESEDFGTTGGLVLGLLGRPPNVGDEVAFDGHIFRVESVDGARIAQLNVRDNSSGKRPDARGSDARQIFLRPQDASPAGRRAVLEKIEALLKDRPNAEVELVAEGGHGSRRSGKAAARSSCAKWPRRGGPQRRLEGLAASVQHTASKVPYQESGRLISQPAYPTAPSGFPHRHEVRS